MPPSLVSVHVWGIRPRSLPAALGRMALDRLRLRSVPGLRFAKLLGTGDGRTFTLRDADPLHWALVAVWASPAAADSFAATPTARAWAGIAHEHLEVRMTPLSSRGTWAGQSPFDVSPTPGVDDEEPAPGAPRLPAGPVASITRARLRPSRALSFWRAVPPVSADLAQVTGLRLALGIGEAPIGLQGTFSLWSSQDALTEFAFRRRPHLDVLRATPTERWYTEELFARFAVRSVTGTFGGVEP